MFTSRSQKIPLPRIGRISSRSMCALLGVLLLGGTALAASADNKRVEIGGKEIKVAIPAGYLPIDDLGKDMVNLVHRMYPAYNVHAVFIREQSLKDVQNAKSDSLGAMHLLMTSRRQQLAGISPEQFRQIRSITEKNLFKGAVAQKLNVTSGGKEHTAKVFEMIAAKDIEAFVDGVTPLSVDRNDENGIQVTVLFVHQGSPEDEKEINTEVNSTSTGYFNETVVTFSTVTTLKDPADLDSVQAENREWFDATVEFN